MNKSPIDIKTDQMYELAVKVQDNNLTQSEQLALVEQFYAIAREVNNLRKLQDGGLVSCPNCNHKFKLL